MRLVKARVRGYRSIIDTGYFDVEEMKTILVGPNEAGKTALLQALQKLNPPAGDPGFDVLRDYPRSKYDEDIECGNIDVSTFTVVEGHFALSKEDKENIPEEYRNLTYIVGKTLNNNAWHRMDNVPEQLKYSAIEKDLIKILTHIAKGDNADGDSVAEGAARNKTLKFRQDLDIITQKLSSSTKVTNSIATSISGWLDSVSGFIEAGSNEEKCRNRLKEALATPALYAKVLMQCDSMLPKLIFYDTYFRVHPSIHLANLARRTEQKMLDDGQYDYGNNCLLKLLGFTASELSEAGSPLSANSSPEDILKHRDILDRRDYRLNAASLRLTKEIAKVWNPNTAKGETNKLKVKIDGQYLKVVVEDELGVEIEFNQRSEGFQWLVSFFVVFFSQTEKDRKNAILLLDEPGLSLHGSKQVEFRDTLSKLAESNQTIFTTHSPYLIGPDELQRVRIVEMNDRIDGTQVHTVKTATDKTALLPLQEAIAQKKAAPPKSASKTASKSTAKPAASKTAPKAPPKASPNASASK